MEHLHHFGLPQDPFSNEPDLRFYFESGSHRDAQRRVERGLRQHKGLTLLTGDGGMGKTLLARRILDGLEEEVYEATLLVMLPGAADATGILQRFARQLGCEDPSEDRAGLLGQIYEQLAIVREDGRHAVLMVDDAQIMTPEVFAELSGLLNLEYEDRRLISMLFVGSPDLDELVQNDPSIMPRVDVRVRLQPLDMENATAYLNHRLAAVKGNPDVLPTAAMEALYKFGRGRPRLLNTLADNALFEAYLAGRPAIDPSDVERAAADLGIGPDPGSTFGPLSLAPVPPPPPTMTLSIDPEDEVVPAAMPSASLDLDEPVEDFELTPAMEAPGAAAVTLDLDEGLEAALEDFGDEAPVGEPDPMPELETPVAEPDPMPELEALDFAVEPPTGPGSVPTAFENVPAAPAEAPAAPEPVLQAVPSEEEPLLDAVEAEFELGEIELAPLGADEDDQLEDALVELLEE